jgi:hypothetical protein
LNCHYPYISNIPTIPVHLLRKIKFPGLSLAGTRGAMHDPRVILQDIEEAELHEAAQVSRDVRDLVFDRDGVFNQAQPSSGFKARRTRSG